MYVKQKISTTRSFSAIQVLVLTAFKKIKLSSASKLIVWYYKKEFKTGGNLQAVLSQRVEQLFREFGADLE